MNNLGIDITNKFVLVRPDWFRDKTDVAERVVRATGGFGCSPDANGRAVFVEFVTDGVKCRVEGYDLEERLATAEEVAAALAFRRTPISPELSAAVDSHLRSNA